MKRNFADAEMCADLRIHDKGDGNPHAHIMLTMRPMDERGEWATKSKREYLTDENGERINRSGISSSISSNAISNIIGMTIPGTEGVSFEYL
ncbi:MAG: MobA/MobL family protein [Burkholderiales bacterium]|nr:MobA/MobL family protein [Burkholderiales bacterium]